MCRDGVAPVGVQQQLYQYNHQCGTLHLPFSNPGSSPVSLAEITAHNRTFPQLSQVTTSGRCKAAQPARSCLLCWRGPLSVHTTGWLAAVPACWALSTRWALTKSGKTRCAVCCACMLGCRYRCRQHYVRRCRMCRPSTWRLQGMMQQQHQSACGHCPLLQSCKVGRCFCLLFGRRHTVCVCAVYSGMRLCGYCFMAMTRTTSCGGTRLSSCLMC